MTPTSYAVSWREDAGSRYVGRLELSLSAVRLEGRGDGVYALRTLPYRKICDVSTERPNGHRVLVLAHDRGRMEIDCVDRAGSLTELRDAIRTESSNRNGKEAA